MLNRIKKTVALSQYFLLRVGIGLLIAALPLSTIANSQPIEVETAPVAVDLEYVSTRNLAVDNNVHTIGQRSDYLPEASSKADLIVLRLTERRVYVYDGDYILDSFPVAIGAPDTPTPTGQFEVFQMIVDPVWQSPWTGEIFTPGANSALGLRWIGFTELPNGIIGFHGTPTVSSIGRATSNGCVRLSNEDVLALYAYVQIGMTVVVEP